MANKPPIRFTNSLTQKKEAFQPLHPDRVTFYSCGPTVYNYIHIGNLRSALVADLIYRFLQKRGFQVHYVRNYTDVDDKIIDRAAEENLPPHKVAEKYIREVEKDYEEAGLKEPLTAPRATEYVEGMIEIIERMIEQGKAYVVEGGEVLFSIEQFPDYGKLSHKHLEDLEAGARVEVNPKKKNPLDFTLWKPAKEGEPSWESPWGKGRPGWHIECSTMILKCLGDQIDIHQGGEDLIFPHHENEIAQSESVTEHVPFAKYWLHSGFLTVSEQKMSKSLGNIFTAREFFRYFSGEMARYLLLGVVHYRHVLDFSEKTIDQVISSLERIYEAKAKALEILNQDQDQGSVQAMESNRDPWPSFLKTIENVRASVEENFANDLNIPGVLASMFSAIREFNRILKTQEVEKLDGAKKAAQELMTLMEKDVGDILGIAQGNPDEVMKELNQMRENRAQLFGELKLSREDIERMIEERNEARKQKDFRKADLIRDHLSNQGVEIKDSPQGTTWKYR